MVYLDDVVAEVDLVLLLAGAVLEVEDADEVRGPAAEEAVEELEQDAAHHAQLGEGVGERQEDLGDLVRRAAEPCVVRRPAVPEQARQPGLAAAAVGLLLLLLLRGRLVTTQSSCCPLLLGYAPGHRFGRHR